MKGMKNRKGKDYVKTRWEGGGGGGKGAKWREKCVKE